MVKYAKIVMKYVYLFNHIKFNIKSISDYTHNKIWRKLAFILDIYEDI